MDRTKHQEKQDEWHQDSEPEIIVNCIYYNIILGKIDTNSTQ